MKPRQQRSIALLVNTRSRNGDRWFRRACAAFADRGVTVDAQAVDSPDALAPRLRQILKRKPDIVALGGGDGTISALVDEMVGHDVALGVLPFGTANSFARSLGIPLEVDGAVETIVAGRPRRIDLGRIGDDYFANAAAIGLSPRIAQTVPHAAKRWFGRAGYLAWAAIQFARFRPFTLIIDQDGTETRLRVVEVRIANGAFHGGTELVDSARVDSGQIVVQAVKGHVRRRLIGNWAKAVLGLPRHDDSVDFRGARIGIRTEPPLPISIDGEVLARTPAVASIAAGVIEVMVPARTD